MVEAVEQMKKDPPKAGEAFILSDNLRIVHQWTDQHPEWRK